MSPEKIVNMALKESCKSISYTYTEPTVFFEYAFDVARMAHENGLANVFVTNGYIEDPPLAAIGPYLDAANIDLKGFSSQFYTKVCGAHLEGVLSTIRKYRDLGIWVELTTLLIPGYNDHPDELARLADFIIREVGQETPWHVSAFFPTYKLQDAPKTPPEHLANARQIGLDLGLRYVYTGNITGVSGENTYCYSCGRAIVKRIGYSIIEYDIVNGSCCFCRERIDGVGL
jgi:pyruvate formate lyase activating enzyme